MSDIIVAELTANKDGFEFAQSISSALTRADLELSELEDNISESTESLRLLTPECDKIDYILAASSGALCGLFDIFLVGKPGESPVGSITDKWFADRTKDFAKLCGWNSKDNNSLSSAIKFLENKFDIPYDQSTMMGAAKEVFELTPDNHHFKSLGHNPSFLGLFFSILDQFGDKSGYTSHFINNGNEMIWKVADSSFTLEGNNVISKLFFAFKNWFGHLISDMSGSHSSKGRGMGIPSPLWTWTNDIIAIKNELHIPVSEFDKSFNELALEIFEKGYDSRFQSAQVIPVIINEMIVRLLYSVRRMIRYFLQTDKDNRSFSMLWKSCEPFKNATVKRMLTVAHGSFCLVDIGDATIRSFATGGGTFNAAEFFMRLNIVGIGRFTISLYGEAGNAVRRAKTKEAIYFFNREKVITENYIEALKSLSLLYDDQLLLTFVDDFKSSDLYMQAFEKSVQLAEKRDVPDDKILKTKTDIDTYFDRGNQSE